MPRLINFKNLAHVEVPDDLSDDQVEAYLQENESEIQGRAIAARREQFEAETITEPEFQPTAFERTAAGAAAFNRGVARGVGEPLRAAGTIGERIQSKFPGMVEVARASHPGLIPNPTAVRETGEAVIKAGEELSPVDPTAEGFFNTQVPEGFGQLTAQFPLGGVSKGVALTSGGLSEFMDAYDRELARQSQSGEELDEDKALLKSGLYAAAATTIESKFGLGRLVDKLGKPVSDKARSLLGEFVKSGAAGFGEESTQRLIQDLIVEGKADWKGIATEGALGAIVQAPVGTVLEAARPRSIGGPPALPGPARPPIAPVPGDDVPDLTAEEAAEIPSPTPAQAPDAVQPAPPAPPSQLDETASRISQGAPLTAAALANVKAAVPAAIEVQKPAEATVEETERIPDEEAQQEEASVLTTPEAVSISSASSEAAKVDTPASTALEPQATALPEPAMLHEMYGGPAKAIPIIERQLATVDSDPQTRRAFTKQQRAMLGEVLNLLRQRAEAAPATDPIDEWLTSGIKKLGAEGGTVMADPFLVNTFGRPAVRSLLIVVRAGYRATKNLAQAVKAGIAWLKANYPTIQFNPDLVGAAIEKELAPLVQKAGPPPVPPQPGSPDATTPAPEENGPTVVMDGITKLSKALAFINTPEFHYRRETHAGRSEAATLLLVAFDGDLRKTLDWIKTVDRENREFTGVTDSIKTVTASMVADHASDKRFAAKNVIDAQQWKKLMDDAVTFAKTVGSAQGQGLESMRQASQMLGRGAFVEEYEQMIRERQERMLSGKFPKVHSEAIKLWLLQSGGEAINQIKDAMAKANNVVSRALKQAQRDYGVAWNEILKASVQTQGDARREIYKRILAHPMLQGLSQADALELTNLLNKAWVREWQRVFRTEFNRVVSLPNVRDAAKVKEATPELVKQANLGLLDNSAFRNALARQYKVKTFSEETARKIYLAAQEAQKKPFGSQRATAYRQVLNIVLREGGLRKRDLLGSYWYASVLAGFGTQGRNILGNTTLLMDNFVAFTVRQPDAFPALVGALVRGMRQNAQGEFGAILKRGAEASRLAPDIRAAANPLEVQAQSENAWLRFLSNGRYVARFMLAVDSFFYDAGSEVMATFDAFREGKDAGLSRAEIEAHIGDRLKLTDEDRDNAREQAEAEIAAGVTEPRDLVRRRNEILKQSRPTDIQVNMHRFGLETTLNNEPDGAMGYLYRGTIFMRKKFPILVPIVPFVRISANVTNMLLEHSPVGLVKLLATKPGRGVGAFHQAFAQEPVTAEQWQQLRAKVFLSHAAMIGVIALAARGLDDDDPPFSLTGTWDHISPEQRRQLMEQGLRPYQIRFGGVGFDYRTTPAALMFAMIGNWLDGARYRGLQTKDAEVQLAAVLAAGHAVIIDQQFLSGLMGWLDRPTFNADSAEFIRRAQRQTARTVTGLVPQFTKEIDSMVRPEVKRAKGFFDYIQRDTPVARWSMENQVNVLGEDIKRPRYPWSWLVQTPNADPVWDALGEKAAKGVFVPAVSASAKVVQNGERVKMSDAQFQSYQKVAGQLYRERLTADLEAFKAMSPEDAKVYLERFERLRAIARDRVQSEAQ